MRLSLQGYFDLGASFGLAGTEQIANMGIVNPCSGAEVHTLSGSGIEDEWKKRAVKKANDPELHLDHVVGSSTNHSEADDIRFRKRLADCIKRQRIELFELHIYPIGTVFLRMDLGSGVPDEFVEGVLRSYEWAAYESDMSERLWKEARNVVDKKHALSKDDLWKISARRPIDMRIEDGKNDWFTLITAFGFVALCVDENDDAQTLKRAMPDWQNIKEPIEFAHIGKLHFGWCSSVVELERTKRGSKTPEELLKQIDRIVNCIEIATVFLGTCEALRNLFLCQGLIQMGTVVIVPHTDGSNIELKKPLSWRDLNRLRSMASAVSGLLNYYFISSSDEDQQFFRLWEGYAHIESRKRWIQEQCSLLYSVEAAKAEEYKGQAEERKRVRQKKSEMRLQTSILAFTLLTLISTVYDAFLFLNVHWPKEVLLHLVILFTAGVILVAGLILVWRRMKIL